MVSAVTHTSAANSAAALKHFETLLSFETDCWDVHHALNNKRVDFVLLDVRSDTAYATGHVDGAINRPVTTLNKEKLAVYPENTLFVVYCAGPHCNGADKAAIRLAKLQKPVKVMRGGITGWIDEGFELLKD